MVSRSAMALLNYFKDGGRVIGNVIYSKTTGVDFYNFEAFDW